MVFSIFLWFLGGPHLSLGLQCRGKTTFASRFGGAKEVLDEAHQLEIQCTQYMYMYLIMCVMCMYLCISMYIYVFMYLRIYVFMYIYVFMCIYVYLCIFMYLCIYVFMYLCIYVFMYL